MKDVFVIPREAVSQLSRIRIVDPATLKLGSSYIRPLHSDDDSIIFRDPLLENGTLLALTRLVYAPDGGGVIIIPEENDELPADSVPGEVTSVNRDQGTTGNLKP